MKPIIQLSSFLCYLTLISTAAAWSCSAETNVILADPNLIGPQLGAAGYLKNQHVEPWPRDEANPVDGGILRVVRYCYVNDAARNRVHCRVMGAFAAWARALGPGNTRKQGKHSLAWLEARNRKTGELLRCFGPDYKDRNNTGPWNPEVPNDTLAIYHAETNRTGSSSASVGYRSVKYYSDDPGRHMMLADANATVGELAHEVGHVLGMVHEQCRNDRDDFVEYRCEMVQGFNAALARAASAGETNVRNQLCGSWDFAKKYGFYNGMQYTKNDFVWQIRPGGLDEPGGFDLDSIMLYDSRNFAVHADLCERDAGYCPLSKIQYQDGKKTWGRLHIDSTGIPSAGDVAFLQRYYPWEDANGAHQPDPPITPGAPLDPVVDPDT